jgi:hypothetical protein
LFYESTVALSGVYYPTSPLILHHIIDIAGHLYAQESNALVMNIVSPMKLKFLKYWQNIPLLYSFAFVLDPRAKMRGFHNVLTILSQLLGFDYSNYYSEVRTELYKLYNKYETELYKLYNKYETKFGAVRGQRNTQATGSTGKTKTAWGKIYGSPATPPGSSTHSSTCVTPIAANSELASYLDSDTVTCFDEFNLMNWWHEHKLTYPILSIMARDIMVVPVSTVSSESFFSLTGRVIEEWRRWLLPHTVEMLTCVKDWELGDARAQHEVEKGMMELKGEGLVEVEADEGPPAPIE